MIRCFFVASVVGMRGVAVSVWVLLCLLLLLLLLLPVFILSLHSPLPLSFIFSIRYYSASRLLFFYPANLNASHSSQSF